MKRSVSNVVLIGIMIFLPLHMSFAATIKIGLIDTQKIMRESRAAKKARDVFLKDRDAKGPSSRLNNKEPRKWTRN